MGTVHTGSATIHFTESGAGPPVILTHSYFCTGAMWSPVLPAIEATHRVLNVDLRGHGRSSPIESPITIYDLMSDCFAVLDEVRVRSAVWVGLSIGGMIAMRAALVAPERVAALVLLDTDAGPEAIVRRLQFGVMSGITRVAGIRPFLSEICRRMFGATTRRENPALVAEWRERFAAADVPSMRHCLAALNRRDSLLERLPRIAVPALVIAGEEDVSLPPSRSRRIKDALPNAELRVIPRAGHLSTLEQPQPVGDAIEGFLKRVAA